MIDRSCIIYSIFITLIRTLYSYGNCTNDTLEYFTIAWICTVKYLNF